MDIGGFFVVVHSRAHHLITNIVPPFYQYIVSASNDRTVRVFLRRRPKTRGKSSEKAEGPVTFYDHATMKFAARPDKPQDEVIVEEVVS